jgi:hypothetical protein
MHRPFLSKRHHFRLRRFSPRRPANNGDWYHRRGDIQNYDSYPENQHGDISGLKDYANDDDAIGSAVINTLIKAHGSTKPISTASASMP